MLMDLTRNWWIFLIRGIAAIIFAVLAFFFPELTLGTLVLLAAAYLVVDGIFTLIYSFGNRANNDRWWVGVVSGLLSIILGVMMFLFVPTTLLVLAYYIAAWAIIRGILEIVAAIRLREVIQGEWAMILGGILSIILGVLIFFFPGSGLLAMTWLIGAYALVFGFLMILLAFRLRRIRPGQGDMVTR